VSSDQLTRRARVVEFTSHIEPSVILTISSVQLQLGSDLSHDLQPCAVQWRSQQSSCVALRDIRRHRRKARNHSMQSGGRALHTNYFNSFSSPEVI